MHESSAAIGIDCMVAAVIGDEYLLNFLLSASPQATESMMPLRNGTTVDFMFSAS